MVQTVSHREVFRHVAHGIGRTVIGDTVPWLRSGKQRGTDVAATQENNSLHTRQQLVGIGTMIGFTLDDVGILLAQDAIMVNILGTHQLAIIVETRMAQLGQNHCFATSLLNRKDHAVIAFNVRLPSDTYTHTIATAHV